MLLKSESHTSAGCPARSARLDQPEAPQPNGHPPAAPQPWVPVPGTGLGCDSRRRCRSGSTPLQIETGERHRWLPVQ